MFLIILDRAPHHMCLGPEGSLHINSARRSELVEWLEDQTERLGIETVS